MNTVRIIARLDIKGHRLIKGIHLEGWRFVGDPNEYSRKYYQHGIDEIIYIDSVASLYNRETLIDIIRKTTEDIFVPLTVGGGVRTVDDAYELLRAGADKIAVNTQAVKRPELITEIAQRFGRQCMVLSVQAKKMADHKWEAYIDSSREPTGLDVIEWAEKGVGLGAGEVLVTSIDKEGTCSGFDIELVEAITSRVSVPVIASGGFGQTKDFIDVVCIGKTDAVAIASSFHFNHIKIEDLREELIHEGLSVRKILSCVQLP